jgi:hypothetical protein
MCGGAVTVFEGDFLSRLACRRTYIRATTRRQKFLDNVRMAPTGRTMERRPANTVARITDRSRREKEGGKLQSTVAARRVKRRLTCCRPRIDVGTVLNEDEGRLDIPIQAYIVQSCPAMAIGRKAHECLGLSQEAREQRFDFACVACGARKTK